MMNFTQKPDVYRPSIASSAMLVNLSISVWTARKLDKKATNDVISDNGADRRAGNFNKNLLAGCQELDALQKFASSARAASIGMTVPWSDSGLRLLSTQRFFKYNETMEGLKAEFNVLLDKLGSVYDWQVMQTQSKLGNLFNAAEYPTWDQLQGKFGFSLNYIPVPEAGSIQLDMEQRAQDLIIQQYEEFYGAQIAKMYADVQERLQTELGRFVNQLRVEEGARGRIYDSTIRHVERLAEMLEEVNFQDDVNIALFARQVKSVVAGMTREDLVNNEGFRMETKATLEEALKNLPSLDM